MFKARQVANPKAMEYASAGDFCRIFDKDMSSLYLLSLLLTGNHEKAELCFVEGLQNAINRNRIFKEWARSWARRVIIQNALRIINPRQDDNIGLLNSNSIGCDDEIAPERVEIAAVLRLQSFDRFVFVMSVLEGYSDQDCSVLLGCTRRDVLAARTRALQKVGQSVEFLGKQQASAGPVDVAFDRDSSTLVAVV